MTTFLASINCDLRVERTVACRDARDSHHPDRYSEADDFTKFFQYGGT